MAKLQYHTLNFFYDSQDGSALTILVNGVRFHIIADPQDLTVKQRERDQCVATAYKRLLNGVKKANGDQESDQDESVDSGIDVSENAKTKAERAEPPESSQDAEEALHAWIVAPLETQIEKLAPASKAPKQQTLREWYNSPCYFFNLEVDKRGNLTGIELESTTELEKRVENLVPHLSNMPKYIRELKVRSVNADELIVLECSEFGGSYHPTRVCLQDCNETYFLKLVDNDQPQPTKREISMLHRIAGKGLHESIKCPKLQGLVTFDGDRRTIMGFLQTEIASPTPLTMKLDPSVPKEQREAWAAESRRMKDVLHDNGIIWGDAKADNFMVDADDELWIIDFGGSYTEGWIDPEIMETEEGDDMGVEKIANALYDPVANVWDADEEDVDRDNNEVRDDDSSRKRKADQIDEEREGTGLKRRHFAEPPKHDAHEGHCFSSEEECSEMDACEGKD